MKNKHCKRPTKVKLIVGAISNSIDLFKETKDILIKKYGPVDFESPVMDFNQTDYYKSEMGEDLKKIFFSFERLISSEKIKEIKIDTNSIEENFFYTGTQKRRINLDPGYISAANLILATTKDFSHRIYLGQGIYAEVTLIYTNKKYHCLEWTFPDFRTQKYHDCFLKIREQYMGQLKNEELRMKNEELR